ncbi:MAG: T9SS type A sorting domain-containing protein [Saprospiraceae bacterium]|nr:T9SS type A sorting domain-containing protein [Saprospiraceae bacterium]
MKHSLTLLLIILASSCPKAQTFADLPGPMGTINCLLQHPDGKVYMGSNSKGVYQSTDGGQNWTGLGGNTFMAGRVNDLLVGPSGGLLASTEQAGVKSWDGNAWTTMNTGLPTGCNIPIPVRSLAKDASGQLFAGAHSFFPCFPFGDVLQWDGAAWVSIGAGMSNTDVNTLEVDPVSQMLFAGTDGGLFQRVGNVWNLLNHPGGNRRVYCIRFISGGNVLVGTDKGLELWNMFSGNWSHISGGLPDEPIRSFAMGDSEAEFMVGTGYDIGQQGPLYGKIYQTTNGGQSWSQVAQDLKTTTIQALYYHGNNQWLAGGWGVFRTVDDGTLWSSSNAGFSGKTFSSQGRVAVSHRPGHALFYGSDDGVFRSTDDGISWTPVFTNIDRRMITLLKADHSGNVFCGAMRYLSESGGGYGDGELYKSDDDGENWYPVAISEDWRYLEISELENGDLICAHGFGAQPPSATILGSSLAISTDHGENWKDLDVQSGMAFCCAAAPNGDLFVAGESQSVYRSQDGGSTFNLIVAPGQEGNVGVLEVSSQGSVLMGSGGQRTLYFSNDGGTQFESFNSPVLPDYRGVSDVIFDHNGVAYCSTSGVNGMPSLFTIEPPFAVNTVFNPVSGVGGSLFKMTWDVCGFLYIYRAGGILRSTEPLRTPEPACNTGVNPVSAGQRLNIYPNPVSDELHVTSGDVAPLTWTLFAANGQSRTLTVIPGTTDISLKGLASGVFLIRILFEDGQVEWHRVVKM